MDINDPASEQGRPLESDSSRGGRAAEIGHSFQDEVCAYHMVLMLAGEVTPPPGGLFVGMVASVWPQADLPVNDVVVTTSEAGGVYIEATTQRLILSPDPRRSKLHKCLAQFAHLYVQGRAGSRPTGVPKNPWDRELDTMSDRLVIATGPGASARAVRLLSSMTDAARMSTHDAFSERVYSDDSWRSVVGLLMDALRSVASASDAALSPTISERDAWRLLQCIRVVRFDFSANGQHMREVLHLLGEHVLSEPSRATRAWNDTCKVAQTAARQSARLDLLQLRQRLTEIGVPLATAPDFRADVEALRRRSGDELAAIDDGISCGPDRRIVVERDVVDEIVARVAEGHVLVHGEPGCGKSWVMKQIAQRCSTDGECLFLRVEALLVRSPNDVERELRVDHRLVDVLRAWQSGKNTIFFDGLDAAREEAHARAVRELIGALLRETTWRVVVSIRTYDKQYSGRWNQLLASFGGTEGGVSSLSDSELETALQQAPDVAAIVERSASELRDLIHNPFNLRLLAEITCSVGEQRDLAKSLLGIRTQVELLEKFWRWRVRRGGNADARESCVVAAARQMVEAGQLTIARTALSSAAAGTELTDLLSDGIIVPRSPRTDAFVGMFHNAFFDFACARLLLSVDDQELLTLFTDTRKVFFIRPSVRLFLAYLLCFEQNARFWQLCRAMLNAPRLPAIWQVVPLDVLADAFVEADQLRDLLAWLDEPRPEAARVATAFLLRSLETRKRAGPPATRVWLSFCSELSLRIDIAFVNPYVAYLELWSKQPEVPADCAEIVNRCARAVWERARRDGWAFGRLTARATEAIARTIAASPEASQQALSIVATEHDHEECRGLAKVIPAIIAVSPSYAADLLIALFSYEEASEDQVPLMPSHVFSLVQSRKQAWEMVWYSLQEDFPALMSASPHDGTRVAIAVAGLLVNDERIRGAEFRRAILKTGSAESAAEGTADGNAESADPCQLIHVALVPTPFCYEEERSSGWYDRYGTDYRHKVLQHFEAWLAKADEDPCVRAALPGVSALLFESNRYAVVWNRCLVATRSSPKSLAEHVFPLLAAPPVLLSRDSEDLVADLLPVVFPLYDTAHRRVVEQAILSLAQCADDPGYRPWLEKVRDRYLARLPDSAVVLRETQRARRTFLAAGEAVIEPQPGWSDRDSWSGLDDDDRHLASAGADVTAESYHRLKQLIAPVERFVESHPNSAPTPDEIRAAFPAITDLEAALQSELAKEAHPVHLRRARTQLAIAARTIATDEAIPSTAACHSWAVEYLLRASEDCCPEPTDTDPARDDEGSRLVWSPAPRIEAASGLISVAGRRDLPSEVRHRAENALLRLAADPVATVREQVAARLLQLYDHARTMMWQLAKYLSREDPSPGVLAILYDFALTRLLRFHPREVTRLAIDVLGHNLTATKKPEVRKIVHSLLALSHVYFGDTDAAARLMSLLTDVSANAEALRATLQKTRGAVVYDDQRDPVSAAAVRGRAVSWYALVAQRSREACQSLIARHTDQAALPECAQDELQASGQTLSTVAAELDFSVPDLEKGGGAPLSDSALLRLLGDSAELLAMLADVDFPAVNSHFIGLLKRLLHVDPERVVGLLARSLRTEQGSIDLRHFESLILDDVLDIVRTLLADHRDLIEKNDQVRSDLVHLLDGFVRVGWPKAYEAVLRLEETVR